jgi:D-3-phosphoglycerate dehydrogenase
METRTVLVTDHHFDSLDVEERLLDGVATVQALDDGTEDELYEQLAGADGVLTSLYQIDADLIATLDRCRVIARYGIGVDSVDVEAATERGIYVTNAPTYGIEEVAVHTVAFLLNLARQVDPIDDLVAADGWRSAPPVFTDERVAGGTRTLPIRRLSTQTVGFVGFGNIGRAVARRLAGFDCRMLAYDPFLDPEDVADFGVTLADFETVVEEADFVTIHAPLTEATRGRFDAEVFGRMKRSAYLINCARGGIVVEGALLAALDAGEIAGAALDVYSQEPLPVDHPLRDHDRVLTTTHVAYYSEESDVARREQAVENVRAVLEGERPPYAVNDPE